MTVDEVVARVKTNLSLTEYDDEIADLAVMILNYCNLTDFPTELLPLIKRKIRTLVAYEKEVGTDAVYDVVSQSEGDVSWSFNISEDNCKEAVYGLTAKDKSQLQAFRRTRRG